MGCQKVAHGVINHNDELKEIKSISRDENTSIIKK
jgi:hypothetical protein